MPQQQITTDTCDTSHFASHPLSATVAAVATDVVCWFGQVQ